MVTTSQDLLNTAALAQTPFKEREEVPTREHKLHSVVRCFGHYGYGSGWAGGEACSYCVVSAPCFEKAMAAVQDPKVSQRMNESIGQQDRANGRPRFLNQDPSEKVAVGSQPEAKNPPVNPVAELGKKIGETIGKIAGFSPTQETPSDQPKQ